MFKVSDDDKLRVRDPLHKQFEGSKIKALDYVIKANGVGDDMDPEALLHACVTDVPVKLKLQRDLASRCHREFKLARYIHIPMESYGFCVFVIKTDIRIARLAISLRFCRISPPGSRRS